MFHRQNIPLLSVALTMLLAACADGRQMRRDLDALQQRNQADSLLTDSTLAMRLADYFTNHGTQAERRKGPSYILNTFGENCLAV